MSLRTAVAALVSVACLASAAPDSALAKGPTKRKVTLAVDGMGCAHEVEPKPAKLEKKKEDALGLRLRNDCGVQRKVLVRVYDAKGARAKFGAGISHRGIQSSGRIGTMHRAGGDSDLTPQRTLRGE